MLSIYAKTIQLCTHYLRERAAESMQGTVLSLARLEIVPTIKNLIVDIFFMIEM